MLLILVALGAAGLASARLGDLRRERLARGAWDVRRGDVLKVEGRSELDRARGLYLEGELGRALELLRDQATEEADELREQAQEALLLDVPPGRSVPRTRRLAMRGEDLDLARVVDDGDQRSLEVLGFRGDHLESLPLELVEPGGEPLREQPLERLPLGPVTRFDSGRLTGSPTLLVGHRRDGRHVLDVVAGAGQRLRVYRFSGGSPPRVDGRRISAEGGSWTWEGDRFSR